MLRTDLLPVLTGRPPPNDLECALFDSPARLGGLGADREILSSQSITKYLVDNILNQDEEYGYDTWKEQMQNRSKVRTENRKRSEEEADDNYKELPEHLQKAVDLAKQKGASSWLTVLPLAEHDFVLHRAAFLDALSLRYGWTPSNMPPTCECGSHLVLSMHYRVQEEAFHQSDTMKYVTSLHHYSLRYAMMLV